MKPWIIISIAAVIIIGLILLWFFKFRNAPAFIVDGLACIKNGVSGKTKGGDCIPITTAPPGGGININPSIHL